MKPTRASRRCRRQLGTALATLAMISWAPLALADTGSLQATIVSFLQARNADAPGTVKVDVHIPRVHMPPCHDPQPFLPGNGRTSGRLTVGVRCPGSRPAIRYIQANVHIEGSYFVAAHAIKPGATLSRGDIRRAQGDITRLPDDVVTQPEAILGQVAVRRIGAGMPLRTDMAARAKAIHSGDSVRVIARGPGFSITTHGKALDSAALGQTLRVSTSNGHVLTGTARGRRTVIVAP